MVYICMATGYGLRATGCWLSLVGYCVLGPNALHAQLHYPIYAEGALLAFQVAICYEIGGLLSQRHPERLYDALALLAVVSHVAYAESNACAQGGNDHGVEVPDR